MLQGKLSIALKYPGVEELKGDLPVLAGLGGRGTVMLHSLWVGNPARAAHGIPSLPKLCPLLERTRRWRQLGKHAHRASAKWWGKAAVFSVTDIFKRLNVWRGVHGLLCRKEAIAGVAGLLTP